MAGKNKKGSKTRARSAVSGKFIKKSTAKKHPRTSVIERVEKYKTTQTGPGKTEGRKKR
jgi:hypothetical protein